jgi:hypothetical protein
MEFRNMETRGRKKKLFVRLVIAAFALLLLIQVVPYGRNHTDPPVQREPRWDSPRTRELFFRACENCHSNETKWPWYSNVAPASWLVQSDVDEGRSLFDVSEWGRSRNNGTKAAGELREGDMPPWYYLPAHPEARLSPAEKEELIRGLTATFGEAPPGKGASD